MSIRSGIIFALIAACGLGAVTTQAKFVYADGGNAYTLMFWRFVASTVIIAVLVLIRRRSFRINPEVRRSAILIGFVWSGAMICYLQSVESISVSLAVLILYSYPVLVMGVSVLTGRIELNTKIALAFLVAFCGLTMMLIDNDLTLGISGIIFAALAASGAAYTFLAGSRVASRMDPIVLTFWVNLFGVFLILPLIYGNYSMPGTDFALLMLMGATLCFIIAIICQFQALARMSSAKAAFIFNFEPVVSIFLAAALLGESLTVMQWVGAAMVIGVLLATGKLLEQREKV